LAASAQIEPVASELVTKVKTARFAPELELLLACSQPTSDREPDLGAILESPLNWDSVLRLAKHHRLLPALHAAICTRDDVPASIRSAISARFQNHERRVLRFTAELARIWLHFEQRKIPVLAHKGAALGQFLYGDPAMREFGDLDFLVTAPDVPRARSALQELGYTQKIQLTPRQEKEYLRSGYEHVFGLNSERNLVEVQWQIVPRFYSIHFDIEALFARSVEVDLDGLRLRTLGKEDLMLVLCVHAAKHEWSQLGMLRDIATLARLDLDWDWIEREASRLGIARILVLSLSLADSLFSSRFSALIQLPAETFRVQGLAAAVQDKITAGMDVETESLRYFRNMTKLRERWLDRMRLAWRLATTPSVGEWQSAQIPDSLFPLYRGVRAVRLLKRLMIRSPSPVE
jgi:hypothetical protein